MGAVMTKRYSIAEKVLFDERQLRILSEFDAFAQSGESVERTTTNFQALRGTELQFSEDSLREMVGIAPALR